MKPLRPLRLLRQFKCICYRCKNQKVLQIGFFSERNELRLQKSEARSRRQASQVGPAPLAPRLDCEYKYKCALNERLLYLFAMFLKKSRNLGEKCPLRTVRISKFFCVLFVLYMPNDHLKPSLELWVNPFLPRNLLKKFNKGLSLENLSKSSNRASHSNLSE